MAYQDGSHRVPPGSPAGRPGHEETSQPVDLSRYRRSPAATPPPAPRSTEQTTSLTGWILGNRGRPPAPAPEPKPRTARVIVILFLTLTALVAAAAGVTYLAFGWMSSQ